LCASEKHKKVCFFALRQVHGDERKLHIHEPKRFVEEIKRADLAATNQLEEI
jgi:hypothetical protein